MKYEIINDNFNMVAVVMGENGKYGILDKYRPEDEPRFVYGRREGAERTAKAISEENDRLDK